MNTCCLLLRLEGPLQSWGYRSRFKDRDTGLEPTKSGVIGLICCALGRDRREPLDDLRTLTMHVRVDREGRLLKDFQTAGAGKFRGSDNYSAPKSDGSKGKDAVLLDKHYLEDASFLVALEGDPDLLTQIEQALRDPVWPLSLGRRSCPPAAPVLVGIRFTDGINALRTEPLEKRDNPPAKQDETGAERSDPKKLRLLTELPPGDFQGEVRPDVPMAWPDRQTRIYADRYVHESLQEIKEP